MKTGFKLLLVCLLTFSCPLCFGQDYEIKTLLNGAGRKGSGGYGAISNKFTKIRGKYANLVEIYGGWYINHRFLLGVEAAALTNNIPVPYEFSTMPDPDFNMSYQYGQVGLMTEYTLWSHRAIHVSFHVMNGAGFTVQYLRDGRDYEDYWSEYDNYPHESNWFFVTEPGIKLEMNLLRWLRFSPGISYRAAFGSAATGLTDEDLSDVALNLTLKFGKF